MIATKRNKKLGRMTQREIEEIKERKRLEEHLQAIKEMKSNRVESHKEAEVSLSKEQFKRLINDRVDKFCKKYNIGAFKTILKFAKLKMSERASYDWESEVVENPYKLMKMQGVGFNRADGVAMRLNFPLDHKYRILAYVGTALEDLSKGSTIIGLGETLEHMSAKLNITNNSRIIDVVLNQADDSYKMLDSNYKVTDDIMEARYLTKTTWYETERDWYRVCLNVSRLEPLDIKQHTINKILEKSPFKLNEMQSFAVNNFYKKGLNILTGWGGTGKSFSTRLILEVLRYAKQSYTCLAPTGIASKVFTKSTGVECMTIHRKYHKMNNRIETDWLILEECSMHSVEHINMIMKMIDVDNPPRILMLGDVSQLLPVSVGNSFYATINLIKCNRLNGTIIKLTEIMRASDELFIPHLSKMFVEDNVYDSSCERKKHAGVDFIPLDKNNIQKQLLDVIQENGFNFENTMILIPQNVGNMGNNVVNSYMDEIMAENTIMFSDKYKKFRKGSYCMNIKNNADLDIFNGERIRLLDRFNGEIICEKIDEGTEVRYDEDVFGEYVQLAYGNSIHKCQGITVENVIFVASHSFNHMNTRELVYTAISRASKRLVILYESGVLATASRKKALDKRVTFLGKLSEIPRR